LDLGVVYGAAMSLRKYLAVSTHLGSGGWGAFNRGTADRNGLPCLARRKLKEKVKQKEKG